MWDDDSSLPRCDSRVPCVASAEVFGFPSNEAGRACSSISLEVEVDLQRIRRKGDILPVEPQSYLLC